MAVSTKTLALRNCLAALQELAGVTVDRNRSRDFAAEELPAVAQFRGSETRDSQITGKDTFVMLINLELYASGATDEAAEEALDDLLARIIAKLAEETPIEHRTLQQIAERVDYDSLDSIEVNELEGSGYFITGIASFAVQLSTVEGDPYTVA